MRVVLQDRPTEVGVFRLPGCLWRQERRSGSLEERGYFSDAASRPAGRGAETTALVPERVPVRRGARLGIDVGSARIGVARCDPGGLLASPLTTVTRGKGDLARLAELAAENDAIEVVVGLPTTLSGREGKAAADARGFARKLAARIAPLPVRLADERFTTVTAHGALRAAGRDSRARRGVVDQAAAAVLLQAALDAERSTGRPPGEPVRPAAGPARSAEPVRPGSGAPE